MSSEETEWGDQQNSVAPCGPIATDQGAYLLLTAVRLCQFPTATCIIGKVGGRSQAEIQDNLRVICWRQGAAPTRAEMYRGSLRPSSGTKVLTYACTRWPTFPNVPKGHTKVWGEVGGVAAPLTIFANRYLPP